MSENTTNIVKEEGEGQSPNFTHLSAEKAPKLAVGDGEKNAASIFEPLDLNPIDAQEPLDLELESRSTATEIPAEESPFAEITTAEDLSVHISEIDEETATAVINSTDLFKTCVLPEQTELQEHLIKTKHDILVGDHCNIEFGLHGESIAVCGFSTFHGDIIAESDLRIDNFCEIFGNVVCNGDVYLGEGVKIHGKLTIGGNLDIGEKVIIDKEFKAYGNISIRNPLPVVLYLLLYIMTMLRIEGEESTMKKLDSIVAQAQDLPLVLPPKTSMNLTYFSVLTPMEIGPVCRLHGNIHAESVTVRRDTTIFGSILASKNIKLGPRDAVHGAVSADVIRVERGAEILGDVIGQSVWMHEEAHISGLIQASKGLIIGSDSDRKNA
ncbi:MAG TPA: acyltransferase [Methanocorpusculum sp.]|nr:acyltransferase [Methanocorpusculum sp.]